MAAFVKSEGKADAYLGGLNPEQRRAVEYGVGNQEPRPLAISAGAGTGKTSTLSHRAAHLVATGVNPSRILLLAFTRRAAEEIKHRTTQIVERAIGRPIDLPWASTFHSVGVRLLRSYADTIGLHRSFTIIDQEDAASLIGQIQKELDLGSRERSIPNEPTCLAIYSRIINEDSAFEDVLNHAFPWYSVCAGALQVLFTAYVDIKRRLFLLDYDDIILYWARAMRIPEISADVRARFDHILVDEFQDTSPLQASILFNLRPDGAGLTVVGDEAQAIYGFRGAGAAGMLDFPRRFGSGAEHITLERNYRSTQTILDAADAVMALAERPPQRRLWSDRRSAHKPTLVTVRDDREQAFRIADSILENKDRGLPFNSQAVLFRASHESALLEVQLDRRKIPFRKIGGTRPANPCIKDVLAVLRWATNPRDTISGYRVLCLIPGLESGTPGSILQTAQLSPLPFAILEELDPPRNSGDCWPGLLQLLQTLRCRLGGWPFELQAVRQWYEPLIKGKAEPVGLGCSELDRLEEIASVYPSRSAFLADMALSRPTDGDVGLSADGDNVVLSTIHSAKGLEWPVVYVINVVDGSIPSDLAVYAPGGMEEERRLLYVAMTRAKDKLCLFQPQRRAPDSRASSSGPSQCMFIPADLLKFFDETPGQGESPPWPTSGCPSDDKRTSVHP